MPAAMGPTRRATPSKVSTRRSVGTCSLLLLAVLTLSVFSCLTFSKLWLFFLRPNPKQQQPNSTIPTFPKLQLCRELEFLCWPTGHFVSNFNYLLYFFNPTPVLSAFNSKAKDRAPLPFKSWLPISVVPVHWNQFNKRTAGLGEKYFEFSAAEQSDLHCGFRSWPSERKNHKWKSRLQKNTEVLECRCRGSHSFAGGSFFHWHFGSRQLCKTGSSLSKTLPGGAYEPFGVKKLTAEVPQYGLEVLAASVVL